MESHPPFPITIPQGLQISVREHSLLLPADFRAAVIASGNRGPADAISVLPLSLLTQIDRLAIPTSSAGRVSQGDHTLRLVALKPYSIIGNVGQTQGPVPCRAEPNCRWTVATTSRYLASQAGRLAARHPPLPRWKDVRGKPEQTVPVKGGRDAASPSTLCRTRFRFRSFGRSCRGRCPRPTED
jgi:hypothetical protein